MVEKVWVECDQCGKEKTGNRIADPENPWIDMWLPGDKTVDLCSITCLKIYVAALQDDPE